MATAVAKRSQTFDRREYTTKLVCILLVVPLPAFGQPMVARMSEIWSQTSLELLRMYTGRPTLNRAVQRTFWQSALLTVITTNSTLIGDGFQSQLKYSRDKTLIVVGDDP